MTQDLASSGFAIVGLAGRFPGAESVEAFWSAIREGRDLIRPHDRAVLADNFTDADRASDAYVPVRPSISDAAMFDAPFFNMLPREAALTDPQFRVFLECCWHALEDAGCDPMRAPGPVGVFGGAAMPTYFLNNVMAERGAIENFVSTYQLGDYHISMGALTDTLATRTAFRLGLTGPALTVGTACSTSMTAVALACQSLDAFQCDVALAGGVSITFPQERGYLYQEGGMVSRDGHCRPFDAGATGTVFGHGAGVVALRRVEDAVADGDHIYAVIRGVGINNDGADKIAFTAPSVTGQAIAIAQAQGAAGVDPGSISYIECHGTGTPLGDPIEFEGLKKAFQGVGQGQVALGSVKANIGHCDAAAGVIGLIKTALMLRDRVLPPMTNYSRPNPNIDLGPSPFRIPMTAEDWIADGPLRAGVSAFGVGGTNVHVIMEEAPPRSETQAGGLSILPLSARNEAALAAQAQQLAAVLSSDAAPELADVAFTLQEGRRAFDHRRAIVAATRQEAIAALSAPFVARPAPSETPAIAFMFPGQGAQYPGMGQGLYQTEPVFARILDDGAEALASTLGLNLADLLFRSTDAADAARVLRDTAITQPALYLIEYATAQLWQHRGVQPWAMIGHSVGEFVAATLSGVMSFETGLALIAARGRLMQAQPPGAMLSVRASLEAVQALVPQGVDLAARNAPSLLVFAGPDQAIDGFAATLEAAGLPARKLHTSHAFHSAMMDPVVEALQAEAARHSFAAPQIPYVSCVTGTWITPDQATDPAYWARHCRACVDFDAGLRTLAGDKAAPALLEVGPGRTLSAFAGQILPRDRRGAVVQSLPDHDAPDRDRETMAAAFGTLWTHGVQVDWSQMRQGGQRVSLPGYPFQKSRHCIEPPVPLSRQAQAPLRDAPPPAQAADTELSNTRPVMAQPDRTDRLTQTLLALLSDLSGDSFTPADAQSSFLELGFDSLLLGQLAQRLDREMGCKLTFRQLMTDYPDAATLVAHLDTVLPADPQQATAPPPAANPQPVTAPQPAPVAAQPATSPMPQASGDLGALMQAQTQAMLSLFETQIRGLSGGGQPAPAMQPVAASEAAAPTAAPVIKTRAPAAASPGADEGSRLDMNRRAAGDADLSPEQMQFVRDLCQEYSARFPTSKARTQANRRALADPRTAGGFRPEWKELVFPIIAETAHGSQLTDPDGNTLIDLVNGFGQTAFGHAPDFVTRAVSAQLDKGFPIGPQTALAHEVAQKFIKATGHERVTFCNTGSEAVMAAIRLARTVTGRDTVVCFNGDYHGMFDEVLVRGRRSGDPTAMPAVAGIPAASVSNMVVLSYGSDEALDWIRENIDEVAAVLVEPIQSRHPELRPRAFVEALREITAQGEAALILDEIVTGFRVAAGGIQELWQIRPDLATYGKVVGGGMPIGVLAGDARFMDALDGGFWSFGDDSIPEVAPTFFAGTFVRHPLVLAAASAVLDHIAGEGRALYDRVGPRTQALLAQLNDILQQRGLPPAVTGVSSWLIVNLTPLDPRAGLLFPLMRLGGVHVIDGYGWFFTTAHSEEDFAKVAQVFAAALDRLQAAGILLGEGQAQPEQPRSLPLTEPMKEVWMAAQLGEAASSVFIESARISFDGDLDAAALETALNHVIARHDALRLRFDADGGGAEVMPDLRLTLTPEDTDPDGLQAIIAEDARTGFDLVEGPLIRARLLRLQPDRHVLILTSHHIVCDGWSTSVVLDELATLYDAQRRGTTADLPPAPSFADYARQAEARAPDAASVGFWQAQFPQMPELPELPTDARRDGMRSFTGATHIHRIDAETTRALKRAAGREGVTLFAALGGALAAMLGRMSHSDQIVLAVPFAGQTLLANDRLVGHCVNLLPVKLDCDGQMPLRDHLKAASTRFLDCFDRGDMTYGSILRAAGLRAGMHRQPLSEIQFNLDQQPADFGFPGLRTSVASNPRAFTNFDLIFNVTESPEGLRIDLTYASDILNDQTCARWCRQYEHLLQELVADMDRPLASVPLIPPTAAAALAAMGNDTARPVPLPLRADALIDKMIESQPDAIAIEDATGGLSYADLGRESDRLAAEIRRRLPEPGGRVAVLMDRSARMVVALLAVMKAGRVYIPLDPLHPPARLRAVLQAAGAAGLIHDGEVADLAKGLDLICLNPADIAADTPTDLPPLADAAGNDSAYVIFTSGTTGTPKGVEVPHSALANFLLSMADRPGFTRDDVLLAVTTVSFDIAALELFLPLVCGGRVVIAAEQEVKEAFPLVARLGQGDITMLQATPTLMQMLLEAGLTPDPRLTLLVGGEPLPRDLADRLIALGGSVWNMYGPTETTIWSSCGRVDSGPIDIGTPIANTVMHVLDEGGQLAPIGVIGELNIGGAGLARGYLDRPDLTEAAFRMVEIPGQEPTRLYGTGDLARRGADGRITLLGRRDGQIKLRGFRIELSEIETAMRAVPGIAAAAVAMRDGPGGAMLVGFWVGSEAVDAAAITQALKAVLPAYMIPTRFQRLDALPQTANGKLDRRALPPLDQPGPAVAATELVAPDGDLEQLLAEIWQGVLGIERIGVTQDLFQLGADSLSIFRIAARMLDKGLGIEARHLMQHPTVRAAAAFHQSREATPTGPSLRDFRKGARRQAASGT